MTVLLFIMPLPACTSSMTSHERHRMTQLERSVEVLSQQLMMLQLSQEEMRRSDGDSGIKQVCHHSRFDDDDDDDDDDDYVHFYSAFSIIIIAMISNQFSTSD